MTGDIPAIRQNSIRWQDLRLQFHDESEAFGAGGLAGSVEGADLFADGNRGILLSRILVLRLINNCSRFGGTNRL